MNQYRIMKSEQRGTFKIQYKVFFLFWVDFEKDVGFAVEFETFEDAKETLRTMSASDWKPVK